MELNAIIKKIAKDAKITQKEVKDKIKAKQEELDNFVNEVASAHLIARELNVELPSTPKPKPTEEVEDSPFTLVGFISIPDQTINYAKEFSGNKPKIDLVMKREDFSKFSESGGNWFKLFDQDFQGEERAIFGKMSSSGKSFFFFLKGETVPYIVPLSSVKKLIETEIDHLPIYLVTTT